MPRHRKPSPTKRTIGTKQTKQTKQTKSKLSKSGHSHGVTSSGRLSDLLNTISNNRQGLTKSEINLPARLMHNDYKELVPTEPTIPDTHASYSPMQYSKSYSSTFSSTMHNGHTHSAGKEVINDSSKPYIQVAELHNGKVERYMIPKNQTILSSRTKSKLGKSSKSSKSR